MHRCLKAVKSQHFGKHARKLEIEIRKRGLNALGPGKFHFNEAPSPW